MPQPAPDPYAGPPDPLNPHRLGDEEKKTLLANPASAVGRQFILLPDTPEALAYKITGVCVLEDGSTYYLKFIGCVGSAEVGSEEVERMFRDSVLVG
jgi:hypothetical protein